MVGLEGMTVEERGNSGKSGMLIANPQIKVKPKDCCFETRLERP